VLLVEPHGAPKRFGRVEADAGTLPLAKLAF
jgi:hypothetical protein